ncbi:MAG: AhpC/TSA family protein [Rikenellaceae bacterium]|nr:AhpC/TSA family protein [Rikenellaceae bacterium]
MAVSLLAVSCGRGDQVTIKGTFSGVSEGPVYLDRIGMNVTHLVDTALTDAKGRFSFTVSLTDKQPAFFNLRCKDQAIVLLLSPGEKVEVKSLGNLANNYLVEGSPGSEELKELNLMLLSNRRSLDSLAYVYQTLDPQDTAMHSALQQYTRLFIRQKRDIIGFVVRHATSLSSVYALYQRMPNGEWYFRDSRDMVYFQMVADSLQTRYPQSPHVVSLLKDVKQMNDNVALLEMLEKAAVSSLGYPDVNLPDVLGNRVKMSSLDGNVILLDFWVSDAPESRMLNAELQQIYSAYHEKGFSIYQVALDTDKFRWITAVQEQRLPWISVCDFKGMNSPAVRTYNVARLPANVLIDRQREIVARNIPMDRLEAELRKHL